MATGVTNVINVPKSDMQRPFSMLIAANDSSAKGKSMADYVCDGTADEVQINAAITALSSGGSIKLLEGSYSTTTPIVLPFGFILDGCGNSTVITAANGFTGTSVISVGSLTEALNRTTVSNLKINGNSVAGITGVNCLCNSFADNITIEKVSVYNCPVAGIHIVKNCRAVGCYVQANGIGILMSYNAVADGCVAYRNTTAGIGANGMITNCSVYSNVGIGIDTTAGDVTYGYVQINNCSIEVTGGGYAVKTRSDIVAMSNCAITSGDVKMEIGRNLITNCLMPNAAVTAEMIWDGSVISNCTMSTLLFTNMDQKICVANSTMGSLTFDSTCADINYRVTGCLITGAITAQSPVQHVYVHGCEVGSFSGSFPTTSGGTGNDNFAA